MLLHDARHNLRSCSSAEGRCVLTLVPECLCCSHRPGGASPPVPLLLKHATAMIICPPLHPDQENP